MIVNWNTRELLRGCLASIYKESRTSSFEIIVVDNASSDDSVAMLELEYSQTILVKNSENRGFAAANNQGIALTSGRYVLLSNSDTIILNGAIT